MKNGERGFDPKQDIIFKAIFGREDNKKILISLLNGLLDWPQDEQIVDVEMMRLHSEQEAVDGKEDELDLLVRDVRGHRFGLEVQLQPHKAFAERMLFYAARRYVQQLRAKEDYTALKPLVMVSSACGSA